MVGAPAKATMRRTASGRHRPLPPLPRLWPVAGPLLGELVLGIGVGVAGTAMAARWGDASGAAFGLAVQLAAMLFVLFRVVGSGISVVVSQALGAGQRAQADQVSLACLGAATRIGLACALAAGVGAEALLAAMNASPEVLDQATPLLRLLAAGVLLDAWAAAMSSVLRSHLRTRATLLVSACCQALHLALAVPAMLAWGLPGFGFALLASRGLALLMLWVLWRGLGLRPSWADLWRWPRATLAPVLHIGLPGAAENIAWRLAFMASLAAVGQLGTAALATHGYVLQVMHVLLLAGLAIGLAAEVLVGHLIGAGALREADRLVRRALAAGLVVSTAGALLAAVAGPWLIGAFSRDPSVVRLGATLLWVTVLLEAGRSFNLVLVNALRAAGDARYPVQAGALSFALVLAGGSWLLGVALGGGLIGIWLAYAADEWLRGLVMWRRWRQLRWVPAARAAHRHWAVAGQPARVRHHPAPEPSTRGACHRACKE